MFENVLRLKKLTVSQLCAVAMLIAVTVVLSAVSGYLRVGNISKISISFISVYIAAAAFGPLIGGAVGALADIVSFFVNPVGGYMWQFTLIEYAYGFIFGLFFYRSEKSNSSGAVIWIKVIACAAVQFVSNMTLKTLALMSVGYAPSNFLAAMALRLPSCVVTLILQLVVLSAFEKLLPSVLKVVRKRA